ncbi:universal stress protein [Streptomyces sp. GC420]|uniref:universal stress protein n=1 Tax=Streptomyces sp. GC420 TaxID=2697568 RepID=UPI0014150025|nr:universal stress protein [Streptomyces sp. GC420]NBM19644.1 universal stress protein [Streptomyces sp. GC420]
MLRPVVAGVDPTPESLAAAHWAAREAVLRERPLRLVHAWEGLADEEASLPELAAPSDRSRQVLRDALDEVTTRHPGLRVDGEQIALPAPDALVGEAGSAELLVLGSRGLGGVGGFLVGSVAQHVVGQAPRPVVLVRAGRTAEDNHRPGPGGEPSTGTPYRPVVVGVDPGTDSEHGRGTLLDFAFDEAARRRTPLRVVHAWTFHHASGYAPGPMDAPARAESHEERAAALAALLKPWRERYPSVAVEALVPEGRAAQRLLGTARGAGLLIVGRKPRPAVLGPRTGPVTHAAMHHAECPVVIVPHP